MSNKVYFTDKKNSKSPAWPLVRAISWILYYAAPAWAAKKTADLLLTPQGKNTKLADVNPDFTLYKIDSDEGQLQCYETGKGPTVLLTHGWAGGSYQFFPLMQELAKSGYRAIAFDHPGHGHSEGKHSSGPQFIRALQSVIDHCRENNDADLAGIIAHSMGCLAAANIKSETWNGTPLCLIAPAFGFKQNMIDKIHSFGLYPKLFDELLQRFEDSYGIRIDELEIDLKLPQFSHRTLILHDRNDKFTDAKHSENFCEKHAKTRLVLSEGLGHGRIINAEITRDKIREHLELANRQKTPEFIQEVVGIN